MAAYELRRHGYPVTLFEALPVAGGTLAVGTGRFRLPKEVLNREIDIVESLGAKFELNTRIGDKDALSRLRAQGFQAILLAIGAHKATKLDLPGHEAKGVVDSLTFLKKVALKQNLPAFSRVVVVGGSDRSLDAARTALRLGAKSVTVLFSRSQQGDACRDFRNRRGGKRRGDLSVLSSPTKILTSGRKATGISFQKAVLSAPTSLGRRRVLSVRGS